MSNKLLKEVLKPSRIYPLILVLLMYAWWQFYLKPMQLEKNEMLHQQEGYFKTKDKTDVWNAFFSESFSRVASS